MTIVEQGTSGAAPQPAPDLIKETTTQTFVKDVIEESKRQPVLIDFWAPWCGPCKQLTPVLEKMVRAAKGKVKLVKMNIDEHPAIAGQMGIQASDCIVVEDSPVGVAAAVAAGMTPIGFVGGSHVHPQLPAQLTAAGASVVIADMRVLKSTIVALRGW